MNSDIPETQKSVVIIPTLNEVDNIEILIRKILQMYPDMNLMVVDGHSTDGTPEVVERLQREHHKIRLIRQEAETGYGYALRLGFEEALEMGFEYIVTMDGDLSHDPKYIADFLELKDQYDLIIGSRYINGVRVEGWQFRKLLFSKLANMYISYILVRPIWDFTSGFRLYRKKFLQALDLKTLADDAYLIQVQLIDFAYKQHFRIKEIPFLFRDRFPGYSKVKRHSLFKTSLQILRFHAPFKEIIRHLAYTRKDYRKFVTEYESLLSPSPLKNNGQFKVKDHYSVSIGVMAYNEEKNILSCLNALQDQQCTNCSIEEIIVVSSGSTDRTNEMVQQLSEQDPRIKLVIQTARKGKANAINEFLARAVGDIVVIQSADTIAGPQTLEKLVEPFKDEKVGMVGCRPQPVNDPGSMVGYFVHKLWELHHQIALNDPKCGEMIALRNIIQKMPEYTAVDEAVLEASICNLDLRLAYAPEAIVYNKGPETLKDFIKQRRRIAVGHLHIKVALGHRVSTAGVSRIFKLILKTQKWTPKALFYSGLLIFFEAYARIRGYLDFYFFDRNPYIWDIAKTTKHLAKKTGDAE